MKLLNHLDLAGHELRNPVLHQLAGAPSSPVKGQTYFNTTANVGYVWNGTAWRPLDAAGLADNSIPNAALATNPLARANHTGSQTASTISDLATTVQGYRLDQFAQPTAAVAFNGQRATGLADPSGSQDAATKNYVDGAVQSAAAGIDSKPSVRVIATANIVLSGTQTIDGVTVSAGDAVLVSGQTTASQNGVYLVAAGAWSRRTEEDATGEVTPGSFWFVEEGTSYGKTQWRCNNTGAITLGTTAITIVQFGAANSYSAGNGLSLTGTVFAVLLDASSGLVLSGSGLKIDTAVVARKYVGAIAGDGATASFTITHNLGTKAVAVSIRDSGDAAVLVDWTAATINTITVAFGAAPANGVSYSLVVVG